MAGADENDDGRKIGDWQSVYKDVRRQIYGECFCLVGGTLFALICVWTFLGYAISLGEGNPNPGSLCGLGICNPEHPMKIVMLLLFFSGILGAASFSTKWLYHSCARGTWHQDRLIWRLCVPLMGGVLAIFVSFIFAKTFGVSFNRATLETPSLAQLLGFSFLVGVFADGVLAMMERLARNIFGTLESFSGK